MSTSWKANSNGNVNHVVNPSSGSGGADENTPLISLPGGGAPHDRRGFWKELLWDRRHTPGRDSPNMAVRWSAEAFHISKMTLLSSE